MKEMASKIIIKTFRLYRCSDTIELASCCSDIGGIEDYFQTLEH